MPYSVTEHVRRWARITHSGRDGLTVQKVRNFIAECDRAGIPDDTRVTVEDTLREGSNRSGYIEARTDEQVSQDHDHGEQTDCHTGCPVYDAKAESAS